MNLGQGEASAEEKHKQASSRLVTYIITIAVIEFALIGAVIVAYIYYRTYRGIEIPYELLFVGIVAASALAIIPIVFLAARAGKLATLFWKEMAVQLGYEYVYQPDISKMGLIFRDGHSGKTGRGLAGMLNEHLFKLFQYSYETGLGKSKDTHFYTVFEVSFSGSFPHLYLNNRRNRNLSDVKESSLPSISLPNEFEKRFRLHGPKGYEIEALEVFTPDLLAHLLDEGWEHDLELVDQKLLIFREKSITEKLQLEQEIERLKRFMTYLAPKLDRFALTPIGDLKYHL